MKILIAKRLNGWIDVVVIDNNREEHRQIFKHSHATPIDEYIEIYNTKEK